MSIATATHFDLAPSRPPWAPLISAAACTALADWLFYGWQIGVSLALFLGVLGVVAATGNRIRATRKLQLAMAVVFAAGLIALVEDVTILSVIVGVAATLLFVIVITASDAASWQQHLFDATITAVSGPFQLIGDLFNAVQRTRGQLPEWLRISSLLAWIVPLTAFAVFLGLFSAANPLIEYRLTQIDLHHLLDLLDPRRIGFWILIICAIWPLILRRIRRIDGWEPEPGTTAAAGSSDLEYLFGAQAMLRSLILFNALFALQSGLDLAYLWGGLNLPHGMSHAAYAHRGAYPLIVTALLAAGFVLVAMRPGGPAENSRLIRPLVLLWTAQNILLVVSSIFRLDLYVAAYSLTYLRLAAFIWMGLVATGLVLILIQIKLNKSNSWLLSANAIALALALYACCFINAPWLVAAYNVEHSREAGGAGPNLDLEYLGSLGPQAEPALRPYLAKMPVLASVIYQCRYRDHDWARPGNWRAWSFRAWRLERYLANNPYTPPSPNDNGKG